MLMTPCGDHTQLSSFGIAGLPFDAAEVDAPDCAGQRRRNLLAGVECCERISDFERPAAVGVVCMVQRALDGDRGFQSGDVPTIVGLAALAVRLGKEEIPAGVERVHLELVIALLSPAAA